MFIVRSAFWLTVAFMTIHPQSMDVGAAASALSTQMVDAGQRAVVAQVLGNACASGRCAAPTAKPEPQTVALAFSRAGATVQNSLISSRTPYPRPRPSWMS